MNWDKLDLHLENLIPGIALLSIAIYFWPPDLASFKDYSVTVGVAFVVIGYLAGSVGNILARFLLDSVSRWTFRTWLIRLLASAKLEDLSDGERTRNGINRRYSFLIDSAMMCGNEAVVKEVMKRRQTGRLCRSALIPVLLLVSQGSSNPTLTVVLVASTYFAMLLIYGYSEVAVFTEAHRGFRILERTPAKGHEAASVTSEQKPESADGV